MIVFIKENKVTFIIFLLVIFWLILGICEYVNDYGWNTRMNALENQVELCYKNNYISHESEFFRSTCTDYIELYSKPTKKDIMDDTFTGFFTILSTNKLYYISLIFPLLIMICSIEHFHKKFKNGFIKNEITRDSYFKVLKKSVISCYLRSFVFVLLILFVCLLAYFICGHFNYEQRLFLFPTYEWFYTNLPISIIIYFLNIIFQYLFYVNIAFIFVKNNKNIFVCVILSYLCWLIIDIILELIIARYILFFLFDIWLGDTFNLFSIYVWDLRDGDLLKFYISIVLFFLSFLVLCLKYRNKEKVVISCEK